MMNAPLSRFLVEFTAEKPIESLSQEPEPLFEPAPAAPEPDPTITLTVGQWAAQLEATRNAAATEERTRVETFMLSQFDVDRATMMASFEAARETWAHEQGLALSESLTTAVATLQTDLSSCLAQALQPLFAEACRARMLALVADALTTILGDPSHPPIRLEGPDDLLSAFGNTYGNDVAIDYVVSDRAELTVVTDSTRIVSRLGVCLAALKQNEG